MNQKSKLACSDIALVLLERVVRRAVEGFPVQFIGGTDGYAEVPCVAAGDV